MAREKHERRAYHRVADQVLHETWSNDLFAFIGRLQATLHERWRTSHLTAEQAGTVRLGTADLCKIAGKGRRDIALKSARLAAEVTSMSVRLEGEVIEINWPKWADFQGLNREVAGGMSASASSVQRPRPEEEKRESGGLQKAWLNVLSKEPGTEAEKTSFLEAELDRIEAEAIAALPPDRRDKRALAAKTRSLILGWYRQRRRNPNGPSRPPASNGRRLTAVEAGQRILERIGRADPDVCEAVHTVPVRRKPGF